MSVDAEKVEKIPTTTYRQNRVIFAFTQHNLKYGIAERRFPTDIIYIRIFLLLVFFMIILSMRYIKVGDLRILFRGIDSFGNVCGKLNIYINKSENNSIIEVDLRNRSYLLQLHHDPDSKEVSLCVPACVSKAGDNLDNQTYLDAPLEDLCRDVNCWQTGREEEVTSWNRCYPKNMSMKVLCKREIFKHRTLDVAYGTIYMAFIVIFGMALGLFGYSLMLTKPSIFLKCVFMSFAIASGVVTIHSWFLWLKYVLETPYVGGVFGAFQYLTFDLLLGILFTCLLVVTLWDYVENLAFLKQEYSLLTLFGNIIKNSPGITMSPLLVLLIESIFILSATVVYFYMRSYFRRVKVDGNIFVRERSLIKYSSWFCYTLWYWTLRFIFNCGLYIISHSICRWYFQPKAFSDMPVLGSAIATMGIFHLGSVVKGTIYYGLVNKFLIFIIAPYYRRKNPTTSVDPAALGSVQSFYHHYLRFITPVSYAAMAMFGFDLQVSSQIIFTCGDFDFSVENQQHVVRMIRILRRFKYSNLLIIYFMLRIYVEMGEDEVCGKYLSILVPLFIAYVLIEDLCDLLKQACLTIFLCIFVDHSCNVTVKEDFFFRQTLMEAYLHLTDMEE